MVEGAAPGRAARFRSYETKTISILGKADIDMMHEFAPLGQTSPSEKKLAIYIRTRPKKTLTYSI